MRRALGRYFPIFALPTLLAFLISFAVPFVLGIYLSFTEFTTVSDASFVGIDNYVRAFTDNGDFLSALWFTVRFTVVSVITVNVIAFALAYPFALWFIQNRQIKKIYNSNTLMKDAEVEYTFYEPCFSSNDPSGKSRVDYEKLHKIVETKTNMYLMISENQGFMLKKSEMPSGLEAFLRKKAELTIENTKK